MQQKEEKWNEEENVKASYRVSQSLLLFFYFFPTYVFRNNLKVGGDDGR